jgi:hypothetical protein
LKASETKGPISLQCLCVIAINKNRGAAIDINILNSRILLQALFQGGLSPEAGFAPPILMRLQLDLGVCRGLDAQRGESIFVRVITSVQALRAVAAISVVICHFSQVKLMLVGRPNDPTPLYPLASGVDLFFVI